MGLCVFSLITQFSCDDRENVYFILLPSSSIRKYESLTIV